jgi:hypothetical protein
VTIELGGQVLLRAAPDGRRQLAELVLPGSRFTGEPLELRTNRRYLARALALGFRELSLFGPRGPVLCQDEGRQYVWSVLEPCRVVAAGQSLRVASPSPAPVVQRQPALATAIAAGDSAPVTTPPGSYGAPRLFRNVALGTGSETPCHVKGSDATNLFRKVEILAAVLRDSVRQCGELHQALVAQHKRPEKPHIGRED